MNAQRPILTYADRWVAHGALTVPDACAPVSGTYGKDYGPTAKAAALSAVVEFRRSMATIGTAATANAPRANACGQGFALAPRPALAGVNPAPVALTVAAVWLGAGGGAGAATSPAHFVSWMELR